MLKVTRARDTNPGDFERGFICRRDRRRLTSNLDTTIVNRLFEARRVVTVHLNEGTKEDDGSSYYCSLYITYRATLEVVHCIVRS